METITIIDEMPKTGLASAWEKFLPEIEAASARMLAGTATADHIYEMIQSGDVCFWTSANAWACSNVVKHQLCTTMSVFLAGGKGSELLDEILPTIEKTARQLGCKSVHMDTRRGFIERGEHTKRGYKEVTVCVAKELSDG